MYRLLILCLFATLPVAHADAWDWHKLKGIDISKVVLKFGEPTKTFPMPSGETVYTWHIARDADYYCIMRLNVGRKQTVLDYSFQGPACEAHAAASP